MLFIFEMFRRRRQSEPVVEQPPALIPEQQLRTIFRLGVEVGLKQAKAEQEEKHRVEIASLSTLKPKPVQKVVALPVQPPTIPLQWTQRPVRAGGLSRAYHKTFPIPPRPGKRTAHFTPAQRKQILFASRFTASDVPAVKDWPDAG